jgi:uncharacterized SAM-binding protein YcdF (DUF218 family)
MVISQQLKTEITDIVFGAETELARSPCDVMFIFGGSHPGIWQTAAAAYHRGIGETIVAAGGINREPERHPSWVYGQTPEAVVIRDRLVELGVPRQRIVTEEKSGNSLENVLFALKVFDFGRVGSVAAVCRGYVAGRQCRTLRQNLPRAVRVFACPFPTTLPGDHTPLTRDNWTEQVEGVSRVMGELLKIHRYSQRGHVQPLHRMSAELRAVLDSHEASS